MARDTMRKRAVIERTAENDAIYRHIRSEIQFEINMMHARVNWFDRLAHHRRAGVFDHP